MLRIPVPYKSRKNRRQVPLKRYRRVPQLRCNKFGSFLLLAAMLLPCDWICTEPAHAAAPAGLIAVHARTGWHARRGGRIGRLGRSPLARPFSSPSKGYLPPSKVQTSPGVRRAPVRPQRSSWLSSLGRTAFWLFCLGSMGGIAFFIAALVFGLLKFRQRG